METFNYSKELLLTVSFWVIIGLTVAYLIFAIIAGSSEERENRPWKIALAIFILTVLGIIVFLSVHVDRQKYLTTYSDEVVQHMKTVGEFDSVEGKLSFDSEEPGNFKVKIGEKEGQCLVAYPENKEEELQFGCGASFVPLDKAKEYILGELTDEEIASSSNDNLVPTTEQ